MNTREQVLDTINRVYYTGLTTTSGGNISAIDKDGNIFITPSGIDKGTLSSEDIVKVTSDGTIVGKHAPSMELPFHSSIFKERPDIKGVVHAHAPAIVAYATARRIPDITVARVYSDELKNISGSVYDLPGSLKLGKIVKSEFEKGYNVVMMDNHGATVGGKDLNDAYKRYETLDSLCQALINARVLGEVKKPEKIVETKSVDYPVADIAADDKIKKSIVDFLRRSYGNKLVGATYGIIAVKENNKIYFNIDSADRKLVEEKDICVYENGKVSIKEASVYLPLIEKIFETHDYVSSIFISMPQTTMSFAITHTQVDSRLIPESYINLRDVQTAPYGSTMENFENITNKLSKDTPVVVVDNECAIAIGKNITKVFDRMEVLDYSCRSIIMAKNIAQITPINEEQVKEINDTFIGW